MSVILILEVMLVDKKMEGLDTYTYSNVIPDRVIMEFSSFTEDEINKMVNMNSEYRKALVEGMRNYHQQTKEKQNQKEYQKVKSNKYIPKAGFMDVGMFVDIIVISVAIFALILIILGTRY